MSRSRPPKDVRSRRQENHQKPLIRGRNCKLRRAVLIIAKTVRFVGVVAATIAGITTGLPSVVPRISVVQNEPLNLTDAPSAHFVISNDGSLGMNNVKVDCLVFSLESNEQRVRFLGPFRVTDPDRDAPYLTLGDRFVTPCLFPVRFEKPITFGDIAIVVYFRPDFAPWHQETLVRFTTLPDEEGRLHWCEQPMPPNYKLPKEAVTFLADRRSIREQSESGPA